LSKYGLLLNSVFAFAFVFVPWNVQASYGVEDPEYAVAQLAQTTMRSEIGKMLLDQTFKERQQLNLAIVESMNSAATDWGIHCLRYEIRKKEEKKTFASFFVCLFLLFSIVLLFQCHR